MSRATRSARVRLGRAGAALPLLLAALAARGPIAAFFDHRYANLVTVGAVLVTAGTGAMVIHDGLALLFRDLDRQVSVVLRNLGSWGLYGLLALWIVSAFGINVSGLLVGGAILGVVLASAAEMEAHVPATTSPRELQRRIEGELADGHATVRLLPQMLEASDEEPSRTCQVEVRSLRTVEPSAVAEAVARGLNRHLKGTGLDADSNWRARVSEAGE